MYISTKDWKNYIDKLSKLNQKAADAIVNYVQKNGFSDRDALIEFANNVVQTYGSGSAALAAAMYDATAEASGKFYDPAELAPLPEYGEVAKTVHGTLKRSQNVNELGGAVSRLVKRASADTTLQNAYRDGPKKYGKKRNTGAQVAWVPFGDTCPFCLMLASNGWRNQTVGGANHHAEHIHANCDCNYAVRFDSNSGVVGYDPDVYKEMFDNAEGDTWEEKINSMRRANYEKNKDQINAQKRAAYAKRVETENRREMKNDEKNNYYYAAQNVKDSKKPESMNGDYSDYLPLELSSEEKEELLAINKKAIETDYEYGIVLFDGGKTEYFHNDLHDKVYIPVSSIDEKELKVYHSHTNDTPPSTQDFVPLLETKVNQIGVISRNGDTWIVKVGYGIRPTKEEFTVITNKIVEEVNADILLDPRAVEWSLEETNYMATRETFYRVVREFEWEAFGGDINE